MTVGYIRFLRRLFTHTPAGSLERSLAATRSSIRHKLPSSLTTGVQFSLQALKTSNDDSIAEEEKEDTSVCNVNGTYQEGGCEEFQGIGSRYQESIRAYAYLLQECIKRRDITEGRKLHNQISDQGYVTNSHLGNTLVRMYAKCGCLEDARTIFDDLSHREGLTWSAIISAYVKCRKREDAVTLFQQMQSADLAFDSRTLVSILKACGSLVDLNQGRVIHAIAVDMQLETNLYVASSLISMYMRCRSLDEALQVFDKLTEPDVVSWNAMIGGYADNGCGDAALAYFNWMLCKGLNPSPATFVSILKACASLEALEQGKHIHLKLTELEYDSLTVVGNSLLHMYAKCGSLEDARHVFNNLTTRDVVTWSIMIAACSQHACGQEGVALFRQMQLEGVIPNIVTLVNILKACTTLDSLEQGRMIHSYIIRSGCQTNVLVETTLIDMYAKHGSIEDARKVFENLHQRDLVSWNAMITGFVQHGHSEEALLFFSKMMNLGFKPNDVTFLSMLQACSDLRYLEHGRVVHAELLATGYMTQGVVGNTLVDMYANCDSLQDARQVFDRLNQRDVVSWNAMIGGYAQHGFGEEALQLFALMQEEQCRPDNVTFITVLKACESLTALEQGKLIHADVVRENFEGDVFVASTLVGLYASCGIQNDAYEVFEKVAHESVVPWNVLIGGCCQHGSSEEALTLFCRMQCAGIKPNIVTVISILKACATIPSAAALEQGKRIHAFITENFLDTDELVGNTLVHMYASCGSLSEALLVFQKLTRLDVVAWNAMINGYANAGQSQEALAFFQRMQEEGMRPDSVTFIGILKACADPDYLEHGRTIHSQLVRGGFAADTNIGNTVLAMYANCGSLLDARVVFDNLSNRDLVSWNALIAGYSQSGHLEEARKLLGLMMQEGIKPNNVTFASMLNGCGNYADLEQGSLFHASVIEFGFELDVLVGNSLIYMYAKCGSLGDACNVFDNMPKGNVVTWNSMISSYGHHGCGPEALHCFKQMQSEDVKPNSVTFLCLLSACSHAGLVDEGYGLFKCMTKDHGVQPTVEQYAAMVDILGRAGRLDEAEEFIAQMPLEPNAVVWTSLLGACKNHGNIEIGRRAATRILKLEPNNCSAYLLLGGILSAAKLWDEVYTLRRAMKDAGVKKLVPGLCWIDVGSKVHSFVAGETAHPNRAEIMSELRKLKGPLEQALYSPTLGQDIPV